MTRPFDRGFGLRLLMIYRPVCRSGSHSRLIKAGSYWVTFPFRCRVLETKAYAAIRSAWASTALMAVWIESTWGSSK